MFLFLEQTNQFLKTPDELALQLQRRIEATACKGLKTVLDSGAYGGVHGFGERGIGVSNVDRTVGNMCTEIPNAVFF
ncbi:MAG: hypothetical protein O7D29_08310, partial [Gemmatimonadetes bacterium]|nr:hypothetical protein [Gemmatimonadota bacterium]